MDVNEVFNKYSKKIGGDVESYNSGVSENVSQNYNQFKQELMPSLTRYEKWARSLGNFIKIKLAEKDNTNIQKQLDTAHLEVTPSEVVGLAFTGFLLLFFLGILTSLGIYLLGKPFPTLFLFLILAASGFLFYYYYSMPSRLAVKWRLKASSQMVPAVLYTVIYMKHTSNLERAIGFVSSHVEPPLALDFKKILWDVETGKYSTIKDSLDNYLEFWRESNMEFVESFHLIESSLYEPFEARRIEILERALQVILDGVYERMLKFTRTIKSPLTNIYMLGIVLPTLGLALLPLAAALLQGAITATHVFVIFNLLIPFFVFYMTSQIMLKRPGGYGETSLIKKNPFYHKYASNKPYKIAAVICLPLLLIGLIPLIWGYTPVPVWLDLPAEYNFPGGLSIFGKFFDFIVGDSGNMAGKTLGPFGFGALLLSLFIPLSISLYFAIALKLKTKDLIKSRDQTKDLEQEFNNSLFTLGNRLGDGVPAEVAFTKVLETTKGQKTNDFFQIVNTNLRSMGMGLEDAIFNPQRGALVYYPSSLIATSMKILIESAKKGYKVAAQSLMGISEYVKNMHKINERLKDLLAEVSSDMKSNMTFLAPLLAGIVVGLSSMITSIMGHLKSLLGSAGSESLGLGGNITDLVRMFDQQFMIPPYFMQITIGLYIIQIIFILTNTLTIVDAGEDELKQKYEISRNLLSGTILYLIVAFISIVVLSALAGVVLPQVGG
jgi:hypothetical protein